MTGEQKRWGGGGGADRSPEPSCLWLLQWQGLDQSMACGPEERQGLTDLLTF